MEGDPPSHLRHGAEETEGDSIRKGQISIKKETCRQQDGDMEM